MLNINQAVTCLTTANFNQDRDYLIVGTAENLMGFDVFNNLDIFNKEVCLLILISYSPLHTGGEGALGSLIFLALPRF